MAELTINGHSVTVDDSFNNLSPEQQEATVNEIAASLGPQKQEAAPSEGDWRGEVAAGLRGIRKSMPFGQDIGAAAKGNIVKNVLTGNFG